MAIILYHFAMDNSYLRQAFTTFMKSKSTYTLAYEACEHLFSETGQMPTIESIKPLIKINSPTIISKAIKDWKLALSHIVTTTRNKNPTIPKPLLDAITQIWKDALTHAQSELKERSVALDTKQADVEAQDQALKEEKAHVEQMLSFTEQRYQEEINYLKNEIKLFSVEKASLSEQTEHYRQIAAENEKMNAVLMEQIRQEREKYKRLENQYDNEHEWALKRIEEEKQNYKNQIQHEIERLQIDIKRYKNAADLYQAKANTMETQMNELREINLNLERMYSNEKIKLAEMALTHVKIQSELNSKRKDTQTLKSKKQKNYPLKNEDQR